MKTSIQDILVPVKFDAEHLSVVKQAAELAKEHNARLHLLHINDTSFAFGTTLLPRFTMARCYYTVTREKTALLNTWKRWLEQHYELQVTTTVEWGIWKNLVMDYAKENDTDLIILKEQTITKRWFRFWQTPLEEILENSPCQVITLFSEKDKMTEWKQVVIPVTDFVPELRIQTIINVAKACHLKIHLVTMTTGENDKRSNGFYFLTEALKRLKQSGNIQVECKYLPMQSNPAFGYLSYANSIEADVLMTNHRIPVSDGTGLRNKTLGFFAEFQHNHQPLPTAMI